MADFSKLERVYYEDTDAGGVVYHSNYLNFMERCRCEWLASLGFDVAKVQQSDDVMFVVRHVELSFDAPAKLFDELTVTVEVLHVGKVRLLLMQKIYNKQQLLCKARIKLATLRGSSYKLAPMPPRLQSAIDVGA